MVLQKKERDEYMKKIEDLRDYLLANYVDKDGDLFIRGLDFSDFDGNVYIIDMKVKRDLSQSGLEVEGKLIQSKQKVQGNLLKPITLEELAELGYELK